MNNSNVYHNPHQIKKYLTAQAALFSAVRS